MKIAIVSPYSWTTPGGVNAHIAGLAEALRHRGHEVRILAPADSKVPPGIVRLGRTLPVPYNGSVARLAFGPRVSGRLRIALRRTKPDVVHVHEPFAPSASMLAVLQRPRVCVATFHAAAPESRLYRAARPLLGPLWRRLHGRIAVSAAARETIGRVFDGPMRIIPNGIDFSRFASVPPPDPAARTILFLGRLERRKGAHLLIEAAPKLLATHPDARILIAGDGPERARLEAAVPEQCEPSVEFLGRVAHDRLPALMGEAAIVCAPSLGGESFGIILAEAMAAGRPVVASAIPGYAAVARDGVEASLVPPGDARGLAGALGRLLDRPEEARRLGEAGRTRAREFDWEVLVERVEEVYREATAARSL